MCTNSAVFVSFSPADFSNNNKNACKKAVGSVTILQQLNIASSIQNKTETNKQNKHFQQDKLTKHHPATK